MNLEGRKQQVRKRWDAPAELPLSLRVDDDDEFYSDSFESCSSESSRNNIIEEILEKLDMVPQDKITEVLEYVKSLTGPKKQ